MSPIVSTCNMRLLISLHPLFLILLYLAPRLFALPLVPFYCDVPFNVEAVESGRMIFIFPGYAPWHLLISALTISWSPFQTFVWFGVFAGLASMLYIYRAASELCNKVQAFWIALAFSFGVHSMYFSVIGSSYSVDMLAISGMLAHGMTCLRKTECARKEYYRVLAWFCFGCILRPLSMMWSFGALLYLFIRRPTLRDALLSMLIGAGSLFILLFVSFHYYGSAEAFFEEGTRQYNKQMGFQTVGMFMTNLFRLFFYPLWGCHVWLLYTLVLIWQNRFSDGHTLLRRLIRPEFIYAVCLVGPFCLLLVRYLPHAGYLCFLLPLIFIAPCCFKTNNRQTVRWSIAFVVVSLLLFFVFKPLQPENMPELVYQTYAATYTRAGIKQALWGSLTENVIKYDVGTQHISQSHLGDPSRTDELERLQRAKKEMTTKVQNK